MAPGPDEIVGKMRRAAVQYCALSLLSQGEWPVFELVRALAGESGLSVTEGPLYPMLAHLRSEGLVSAAWRELRPGHSRRCYAITPAGSAALDTFAKQWQDLRDRVDVFLRSDEDGGDGSTEDATAEDGAGDAGHEPEEGEDGQMDGEVDGG